MKIYMLKLRPASERYGVSYSTLRNWYHEGKVVGVRAGRDILINCNSLEEYLNKGSIPRGSTWKRIRDERHYKDLYECAVCEGVLDADTTDDIQDYKFCQFCGNNMVGYIDNNGTFIRIQ